MAASVLTITAENTPWQSCGGDFEILVAGESQRQYKPWCHKDNDKNLSHPFCNHRICGLAKWCITLNYNFCLNNRVSGGSAGDNDRAPPLIKSVTSLTIHHAPEIILIFSWAWNLYLSVSRPCDSEKIRSRCFLRDSQIFPLCPWDTKPSIPRSKILFFNQIVVLLSQSLGPLWENACYIK